MIKKEVLGVILLHYSPSSRTLSINSFYNTINCAVGKGGGNSITRGELVDGSYEFAIVGGEGVTFFQ